MKHGRGGRSADWRQTRAPASRKAFRCSAGRRSSVVSLPASDGRRRVWASICWAATNILGSDLNSASGSPQVHLLQKSSRRHERLWLPRPSSGINLTFGRSKLINLSTRREKAVSWRAVGKPHGALPGAPGPWAAQRRGCLESSQSLNIRMRCSASSHAVRLSDHRASRLALAIGSLGRGSKHRGRGGRGIGSRESSSGQL